MEIGRPRSTFLGHVLLRWSTLTKLENPRVHSRPTARPARIVGSSDGRSIHVAPNGAVERSRPHDPIGPASIPSVDAMRPHAGAMGPRRPSVRAVGSDFGAELCFDTARALADQNCADYRSNSELFAFGVL